MTTREEMRSLADEIIRSYEDRISGEAERKRTEAQEIAQRRAAEAERKREEAKVIAQRRDAEAERKRTEAKVIAQRKSDVSTMLKGFQQEGVQRKSDVSAMLKGFQQEGVQRKSDVSAMLKGFREEQAGVRDEWQKMSATMQSKRGGVAVAVKPPIEEIAEGAAEVTPETAALREQVFEYLANHPDGAKLVELAEEFGVARIQIGKVIRSLMDENKVEKRVLLYFAV